MLGIEVSDSADSNAKQAIDKVKQMASTSQTTNHRIYCAVTGTLPPATMSRIPGEDAVKKIAQRARRKMNPRPRAPVSLAGLVLEEEDCRTLRLPHLQLPCSSTSSCDG